MWSSRRALMPRAGKRCAWFLRAGFRSGGGLYHSVSRQDTGVRLRQYVHQIPGGMISNLRHQLRRVGMENKIDQTLEEAAQVRADFGYPIMVTPLSQFVGSQAAINVIVGERYKQVTDQTIEYAMGIWGKEGAAYMDPNVKEKDSQSAARQRNRRAAAPDGFASGAAPQIRWRRASATKTCCCDFLAAKKTSIACAPPARRAAYSERRQSLGKSRRRAFQAERPRQRVYPTPRLFTAPATAQRLT